MTMKTDTVVHINYDWRDNFRTDPDSVVSKLKRDHLYVGEHKFFIVSWSTVTYVEQFNERIFTLHKRARFRHVRPLYDCLMYWKLPRILEQYSVKPDVFVVHDLGSTLAVLRARKRYKKPIALYLSHIPFSLTATRGWGFVRIWYQRILVRLLKGRVDHLFAISDGVAAYGRMLDIPHDSIHYFAPATIPSNVEERVTKLRGSVRKQHNIPDDKHILLSVGRLEPEKGMDRLLRVFAQIDNSDLVLLIVGTGILQIELELLAQKLGVAHRVIFVGCVPHDKLWGYYADADIFVLLSRSEALGMVVWEAFAAQLPVIVSKAEGLVESVGKGNERGFVWNENIGPSKFRSVIDNTINHDERILTRVKYAESYVRQKTSNSCVLSDILK